MPTALTSRPPGPTSWSGVESSTTRVLTGKTAPRFGGASRLPKFPNRTTVERSLYSAFGYTAACSGMTVRPFESVTRKSWASSVLGRTGQLNSTGNPAAVVTGPPNENATACGVDADVYALSGGVSPAAHEIVFHVPPAARTRCSLVVRSVVLIPGTPTIPVNPSPAAIIIGLLLHMSASIRTSLWSSCEVGVGGGVDAAFAAPAEPASAAAAATDTSASIRCRLSRPLVGRRHRC